MSVDGLLLCLHVALQSSLSYVDWTKAGHALRPQVPSQTQHNQESMVKKRCLWRRYVKRNDETLSSGTCRLDFWDHAPMLHVLLTLIILFCLVAAHPFKLAIRSIAICAPFLLEAGWKWTVTTLLTLSPELYDHSTHAHTHTHIRILITAHMATPARTSNGGEPSGRQLDRGCCDRGG